MTAAPELSPGAESRPVHDFRALNPDDDFRIKNFMVCPEGLGLSGCRLLVYALIYSFSYDPDAAGFYGSIDYISARTGASRASVKDALRWLAEEGLVKVSGTRRSRRGKAANVYVVSDEAAEKARNSFRRAWSDPRFARQLDRGRNTTSCGGKQSTNNGQFPAPIVENTADEGPKGPVSGLYSPSKWPETGHDKKDINKKANHPTDRPSESPSQHAALDRSVGRTFESLDRESVNRNLLGTESGRARTMAALASLMAQGFEGDAVVEAWRTRQGSCEGRQARHYPQLAKWLSSTAPDGARSLCEAAARERAAAQGRDRAKKIRKAYEIDREFAWMLDAFDEARRAQAPDPSEIERARAAASRRLEALVAEGVV